MYGVTVNSYLVACGLSTIFEAHCVCKMWLDCYPDVNVKIVRLDKID